MPVVLCALKRVQYLNEHLFNVLLWTRFVSLPCFKSYDSVYIDPRSVAPLEKRILFIMIITQYGKLTIQSLCVFIAMFLVIEISWNLLPFNCCEIKAAQIQGLYTLDAGIFVLIAGYLAYQAATSETRRLEEQQKTKKNAYRLYIKHLFKNLVDDLEYETEIYKNSDVIELYHEKASDYLKNLAPQEWEQHSLLGESFVEELGKALQILIKWKSSSNNKNHQQIGKVLINKELFEEFKQQIEKIVKIVENN